MLVVLRKNLYETIGQNLVSYLRTTNLFSSWVLKDKTIMSCVAKYIILCF